MRRALQTVALAAVIGAAGLVGVVPAFAGSA